MLTLDDRASFCWSFGMEFFLETSKGNFVWKDPDYGGDNTIISFIGDYETYIRKRKLPYCRDKGLHVIRDYCGDKARIVIELSDKRKK